MKKITPRGKNLLVKPDPEKSRTTSSGLSIPTNVEQDKKAIGTVIAVGQDIHDIKPGDHVIYGVYSGEDLVVDEDGKEEKYVLLLEEWVLAFVQE